MENKFFCFVLAIAIVFIAVGCKKNKENSIASNNSVGNSDIGKVAPADTLPPLEDNNTFILKEAFESVDIDSIVEYKIEEITIFNDYDEIIPKYEDFYQSSIDMFSENSKLNKENMIVFVDAKIKAIEAPDSDSLVGENTHHISVNISNGEGNYPDGFQMFYLEETEFAKRIDLEQNFLKYILPKNKETSIKIGFVITKDIYEEYDLFLAFGSNVKNYKYVNIKNNIK